MAGISFQIETGDIAEALVKLKPMVDFDSEALMSAIGAIGESQTRRRISEEKTSPDGTPWQPNLKGTPVLVETGQNLLYSITFQSDADMAEWGSTWEHAHVHQEGMTIVPKEKKALSFMLGGNMIVAQKVTIPARPFVGMSADNREEMLEVVTDFLGVSR